MYLHIKSPHGLSCEVWIEPSCYQKCKAEWGTYAGDLDLVFNPAGYTALCQEGGQAFGEGMDPSLPSSPNFGDPSLGYFSKRKTHEAVNVFFHSTALLLINVLILTVVFWLVLDTAIIATTGYKTEIGFWDSVSISMVVLALRGMFSLTLEWH